MADEQKIEQKAEETIKALQADKEKLTSELTKVQKKMEGFKSKSEARITELEQALADSLTKVEQLQKAAADKVKNALVELKDEGDHVMLGGRRYAITHMNRVKELLEDYKKRYVNEDHTAIVIDRIH